MAKLQGTHNSSTGQLASLAYGSNLTANTLMIVVVEWADADDSPAHPTVSGTQNGSFGSPIVSNYTSGSEGMAIFTKINTKGAVSETINVAYASGADYCGLIISEWSGFSATADGSTYQFQTSVSNGTDTISSGLIGTTADGDLIYSATLLIAGGANTTNIAKGTGFSNATYLANDSNIGWWGDEYLVQSTHGSVAGTFSPAVTGGNTDALLTLVAAFKAAGSGTTVSLAHTALSYSPKPLHVNEALVVPKTTLTFAGKALHTNEAISIAKSVFTMSGKNLHVNEALLITKAVLAFAGKSLHVNEAISIGRGILSYAEKNLFVFAATVVSIAAGAMTWAGKPVSAAVGLIQAVRAVYLNMCSMWTGRPNTRGM